MKEKTTICKTALIKLDHNELIFFRKYAPKGFPRIVCDELLAEGYSTNRIKVHNEITTIKDEYDERIIQKARVVLKQKTGREFVIE